MPESEIIGLCALFLVAGMLLGIAMAGGRRGHG